MPSASYELDNRTRALNKLKWSRNGNEIAVGDDHGQITIFELNENFVKPSPDESKKFLNTINTLKKIVYPFKFTLFHLTFCKQMCCCN